MVNLLRKLFDTSKKDVEFLAPIVAQINELQPGFGEKSDEQLKEYGRSLVTRAKAGETLDSLLPETFALTREASGRTLGMRQFDVQLVGGIVLHQGRIAEMRTGEGKTLVAVAPIILNALTGRGVHLVTVNDYLARRDAVWMGPIYHFLGFSVGIIQGQSPDSDELGGSYVYEPGCNEMEDPRYLNLRPCSRRDAYGCDITYGTNHEYGFDYLRDNMAFAESDLVMRELNYAIVDEVDSILIDEARTPHIISGPSIEDVSVYKEVDAIVRQLEPETHWTADKKNQSASLNEEGMDKVEQLLGIENIASEPRLFHHVSASVKAYALFDRDVDYMVQRGEVIIVDENTGRPMYGRRYSDGLHQALEAKENVTVQRESQTVATITFQNLFRLYNKLAGMTGTAKTEEDEFKKIYGLDVVSIPTFRDMVRVDHHDVIYKTLEAKFRGIGWEILRAHIKQQPVLVGTRSVEMSEKVSARLTPDMLQRLVIVTRLRKMVEGTKEIKGENAKEAKRLYEQDLQSIDRQAMSALLGKVELNSNVLKGDWIEWCLKQWEYDDTYKAVFEDSLMHGVPHNVLNAKFHEQEALIIAEAGRKGQITIATNMAGRGVDILLGGRVEDDIVRQSRKQEDDEYASTFASYRRGGKERAAPPLPLDDQERSTLAEEVRAIGGLYILGTERHESRRIDNQLRGRSGRQGDPGESRFFVSLEDQLWKIFNANMLEQPLVRMWPALEEVTAKSLSGMIRKTQERIEHHFFEGRKQTLEYDDVLNTQREHVYGLRREILLGKDVREDVTGYVREVMRDIVENAWMVEEDGTRVYDYQVLFEDLNEVFPLIDHATVADLEKHQPGTELVEFVEQVATKAYNDKRERVGDDTMHELERWSLLQAVNDHWMAHLQMVDYVREGIGLRGYGQVDPLVAFKRETFDLFQHTLKGIRDQASKVIFQIEFRPAEFDAGYGYDGFGEPAMVNLDDLPPEVAEQERALGRGGAIAAGTATGVADLAKVDWKHVGRNELCPCGSGKKFKACHYPELRQKGVI